ncbi:PD-(D/E)XK nuclease family protein [Micromonosporaceae bacterium B7E4]
MSIDPFDAPSGAAAPDRDRWGRPLIVPPEGGTAVAYTRCTTYVGALEDRYNLGLWEQRMVALGLADRPDLILSVGAHRDDKRKLDDICADAKEAAKAHAAATTGTAVHKLVERLDLGQPVGTVPDAYRADLAAYETATACLEPVAVERFVVLDDLRIGGTPDRVVRFEGRHFIADLKTGSVEFGAGKIAMQLAVYSRSVHYDHETRTREPLPGVDQDRAIVIHLPAGSGRCELKWIDIAAGWEAVSLATQVRAWRARRSLFTPFQQATSGVLEQITNAASEDALSALWRQHMTVWTPELTAAARARKAALTP